MCRYDLFTPYKMVFACLSCRHVAKHPDYTATCPFCRQSMRRMGHDFQAPRKRDNNAWRAVEKVVAHYPNNQPYGSCGCSGPGIRPRTIAEHRRMGAGMSLGWSAGRKRPKVSP